MARVTALQAPTQWRATALAKEKAPEQSKSTGIDETAFIATVAFVLGLGLLFLVVAFGQGSTSQPFAGSDPAANQFAQLEFAEPARESDPMHDDALATSCGTLSVGRQALLCENGRMIPIIR